MLTASDLRNDVYRLLDHVIETGQPLTIRRKDSILRIVCDKRGGRLSNLRLRDCIQCDPESLVHMDWSKDRSLIEHYPLACW